MQEQNNIAIIILAAGVSSRLGYPKQLLGYAGNTLLQYLLLEALNSKANTCIVVLGAHEDQINRVTDWQSARVVVNNDWKEGMASSIRCGINALVETHPLTEGVVFMLCDQPYVTTALLNELMATHQNTGMSIVASKYKDITGAPALFQKSIFPYLLQLKGDTGARSIIQQHLDKVAVVDFAKGIVDIDTTTDYQNLQKSIL